MAEDNIFDMQDWPIMFGGKYRALDPPKELSGLVVEVTRIQGEIDCKDVQTGRPFSFRSAAEFRKHFRPI